MRLMADAVRPAPSMHVGRASMRSTMSASKRQTMLQAEFDRLAPRWDAEHGPGSPNAHVFHTVVTFLRRVLQDISIARVLDVGCGTGRHLAALGDVISLGIGIDLSPKMIERAQENIGGSPFGSRIMVHCGSVETLSCSNLGRFDLIMFIGSLEHMERPDIAIETAADLIAPSGRIVVVMRHPWYWRNVLRRLLSPTTPIPPGRHISPTTLNDLAKPVGLRMISVIDLPVDKRARDGQETVSAMANRHPIPIISDCYAAVFAV